MTAVIRALVVLCILLLASPAALAIGASDLAGLWYGEGYQPLWDREAQWMADRRQDGTFEIEFRIVNQCQVELRQVETGHWDVVADTLQMLTMTIDGIELATPIRHDYAIEEFNGDNFRYRHTSTGMEFRARRVQAGFNIPGCVS